MATGSSCGELRLPCLAALLLLLAWGPSPAAPARTLLLHRGATPRPQDRGFALLQGEALGGRGTGRAGERLQPRRKRSAAAQQEPIKVYGQVSLNDSHNQMVVHWAGEKSNVIVALARDSLGLLRPKKSDVYVSYSYGKTFKKISEKFSFGAGNTSDVAISQFYHSPVSLCSSAGEG